MLLQAAPASRSDCQVFGSAARSSRACPQRFARVDVAIPATRVLSSKKSFQGRFEAESNSAKWLEVKSRERGSMPSTRSPGNH